MKKLLFLFVLLLCSIGMSAEEFEVNGIKYNVLTTSPEYTVEVTGYNSNYEGNLVINGTVTYNQQVYNVVSIAGGQFSDYGPFSNCRKVITINNLPYCTSIGQYAFYTCTRLTSIGDLSACTSIGQYAFYCCLGLTSIGDLSACTSIGNNAFHYCTGLVSIGDLSACTSIGGSAFSQCSSLASIGDLSACTSMGSSVFSGCLKLKSVTISNVVPPTITGLLDGHDITYLVPASAIADYRAANHWSDFKMRVISKNATHSWDVAAPVLTSIGADQFENVMTLKVSGNIDSDDIMYMRNKMFNLHDLDLTNATIVTSDKEYYSGCKTSDNSVGGFFDLIRLRTVKLPTSAKQIERKAFAGCKYLNEVTIPEGIERIDGYSIYDGAFYNCDYLSTIQFPEGMTYIGPFTFYYCTKLQAVAFPSTLTTIGNSAFKYCPIVSISLPENLTSIGNGAFQNNDQLTTLRIPSSLESIGESAFSSCSKLKDIYTYTVQPISINSNTFSNYGAATLHLPTQGFNDYYASPTWGQFPELVQFDEPYKYFYITDDFVLLSGKRFEAPEGEDLDINAHAGSSITIEGETNQEVGNIDIHDDGNAGASIIPDNNLTANTVTFHIKVGGNKWRFLCFPFRVKLSNIQAPGSWVIRRYNGALRAAGGSGWENLPGNMEYLEPGEGYIYQSNNGGTLKITVEAPDFSWATSTKTNTLTANAAANDQDASWNFIGNPLTSYYDIDDLLYDAPLTIWDGEKYVAYRPGDDNYQIGPFEAFFVQKPNDSSVPTYDKDKRMGHNAAEKKHNDKAAAARSMYPEKRERHLLNLVLSNGEQKDQTRVVFNEQKTAGYERECDAAKFMSLEQVPQLYTLEQQTQYAINERQQGSVQVGFTAPKAGTYTLKAERMDMPMVLKDNETGTTFNLKNGEYTFESEAGTFNKRFTLMPAGDLTGIKVATATENEGSVYGLDGRRADTNTKGVVIENGKKVVK